MEKLLILGGKPIGSTELVRCARQKGIYTIVADYLPENESPAKVIADEKWNISVDQVDELAKRADKLGMELAFIDKDAEIKGGKYIIESNAE